MSFDFITLATETDPRRLLRRLDQILGDDDSVANSATPLPSTAYTNYGADPGNGASGTTPVLSKTAEAELYLLATNFLLYVAMVIIATMLKFTFQRHSIVPLRLPGGLVRFPTAWPN
jgi:hypothetical protein